MVRCLLYSSSLPVTFWADALVYAAYINNRLYHSGVQDIPYTIWTGRRADSKHLRTFGAHVSVRRSGARPTKTDPHYFDGRFLRFSATTRNIIYFDTITKRDKTARHCAMDEFHYGTPSAQRPDGAQALLDRLIPNHVPPSDKPAPDQYQEQDPHHLTDLIDTSISLPPLALDSVTDTTEHTITANAAQVLNDTANNTEPDDDESSLPDLIDTRVTNPQDVPENSAMAAAEAYRTEMTDAEQRHLLHTARRLYQDRDNASTEGATRQESDPQPVAHMAPALGSGDRQDKNPHLATEQETEALTENRSTEHIPRANLQSTASHIAEQQPPVRAQVEQLLTAEDQEEIIRLVYMSFDMYATPTVVQVPINRLPTLGLILSETPTTNQVFVKSCQEGTAVSKLHKWRSMIRNSVVRSVNNKQVRSIQDFVEYVAQARRNHQAKVEIRFAKPAVRVDDDTEILQLHFDQLRHLNQLHVAMRQPTDELQDAFLNYT